MATVSPPEDTYVVDSVALQYVQTNDKRKYVKDILLGMTIFVMVCVVSGEVYLHTAQSRRPILVDNGRYQVCLVINTTRVWV